PTQESAKIDLSFDSFAPKQDSTEGNTNSAFSLQEETEQHGHHHKDYGLDSFIYNSRRPFDETKFFKLLRSKLPGVVRAKGFYWTSHKPQSVGLLSIAGKILRHDYIGKWWIDMLEDREATQAQVPENIQADWHPELGDRRQQLVFIGIDLDQKTITNQLRECEIECTE
ncbi:MAG: GTP-binding protein, partial [Coraliomargarita sp.]